MNRRLTLMIGILLVSALLAFPLRDAMYKVIILPAAYLWWAAGLFYHSVHQSIWWLLVLVVVIYILSRSLLPKMRIRERVLLKSRPIVGQVENLAAWMRRTERGIYFKWLLANRLGKIAHQILALRVTGRTRSFFEPLAGPDWAPDPAVQAYLEAGLHGSFADYPQGRNPFAQPLPTPLDHDLNETINYLESQLKK